MSWRLEEFLNDWRTANVPPIFKKGKKHYSGNYRLINFTLVHGKIMNQVHLKVSCRHVKVVLLIGNSHHGFAKRKSCLTNPVTLCDETTGSVNKSESSGYDLTLISARLLAWSPHSDNLVFKLGHCDLDR